MKSMTRLEISVSLVAGLLVILAFASLYARPAIQGGLCFSVVAICASLSQKKRKPSPGRQPYRFRRPEAGTWLEAPIAVVDKSTMGQLLASRMRREPGLHVVVHPRTTEPNPIRADALYDAELDDQFRP